MCFSFKWWDIMKHTWMCCTEPTQFFTNTFKTLLADRVGEISFDFCFCYFHMLNIWYISLKHSWHYKSIKSTLTYVQASFVNGLNCTFINSIAMISSWSIKSKSWDLWIPSFIVHYWVELDNISSSFFPSSLWNLLNTK